ncbi:H(+)/Cl(-) exchange transporter ClcA [Klebsiella sp. BIGb0407]|uniref:H(+)/Cl(-) exchange transporter ClcA n=1 Tax=Klebsiella sp. BIGb0407 TaxID=2940603 RepID=UPI0021670CD0|nr:H(+)/Cl(-) exchange transporter ClcA [Klebsiella sp. BIGb0407]MCS3433157.1 CIC family chloride channel protein [Klebsiella sp. BIGb0407]
MNSGNSSPQGQSGASERSKTLIRRLHDVDKVPLTTLLLAALVGTLAGLAGVGFDKAVNLVQQYRLGMLAEVADDAWVVWPMAFLASALLAMFGYYLVRRFAPEAGGSGIPEIEGALEGVRPVRWWRVIPVKFFGGMGTLGAGMVLGREGPTVQLGGSFGQMVFDIFRLRNPETRHSLVATGAGAGLAAAFNAPLAGIFFVIEELRKQFHYNFISIKAVFIGVIMSTVVYRYFNPGLILIDLGMVGDVELNTLWLYLVLGMVIGVIGVIFNRLVLGVQDMFQRIHGGNTTKWVLIGGLIGGACGVLALLQSSVVGGGFNMIPIATAGNYSLSMLLYLFLARLVISLLCFSSGAPGGIFAPILALGTLLGMSFGTFSAMWLPEYNLPMGVFALVGMGALLSATLRAPLTAIALVLEMTGNYQLILPMLVTSVGATLLANFLGGKPLYSQILARTLAKQEADKANAASPTPVEQTSAERNT